MTRRNRGPVESVPENRADSVKLGRRTIAAGDPIRVLPSKPGKRDGFVGTLRWVELGDDGDVELVVVRGAPSGRALQERYLRRDRVAPAPKTAEVR